MKSEARQIHVFRRNRCRKTAKNEPQSISVFRPDPRLRPGREEALQSAVTKALDDLPSVTLRFQAVQRLS
jgi:hypothetical protein